MPKTEEDLKHSVHFATPYYAIVFDNKQNQIWPHLATFSEEKVVITLVVNPIELGYYYSCITDLQSALYTFSVFDDNTVRYESISLK